MSTPAGRALRWAALLLILCLLLSGCNLFRRRKPPQPYKKLSPPVAYEILRDNPEMLLLDLRRPEEYNGETGHLQRARNLPLARLPYRLLEIATYRDGGTVLVYCHEGTDCGEQGVKILLASGFENVVLMDGGIEQWIRGGFKTVLPANLAGARKDQDLEPLMPAKPQKKQSGPQEVPVTPPPMPPPPSPPPPGVAAPRQIG